MTEKRVRQVNVELPVGLRERFEDFCKENAYLRGRVIAAALTMFMAMPPSVRQTALRGDEAEIAGLVELIEDAAAGQLAARKARDPNRPEKGSKRRPA